MPKKRFNNQQAFWIILALVVGVLLFGFSTPSEERLVRAEQLPSPTAEDLKNIEVRVEDDIFISENFTIEDEDENKDLNKAEIAKYVEILKYLEYYRIALYSFWLGVNDPPPYVEKVIVTINMSDDVGAGGQTKFYFADYGGFKDGTMYIQGPETKLKVTVIPHEVLHLMWAQYFGIRLPYWADEGSCTSIEDCSERRKQAWSLIEFLGSDRGIPFSQMLSTPGTKYRRTFDLTDEKKQALKDENVVMYAQGASVVQFLLSLEGDDQDARETFVDFIGDYLRQKNKLSSEKAWEYALLKNYGKHGIRNASDLQRQWVEAIEEAYSVTGERRYEFPKLIAKDKELATLQEALQEIERKSEELKAEQKRLEEELEALQLKNL